MGLGVLQGCGWCSGPQIGGQSRLGTQVSPHFPTLPGISHVWAGDKARGRRGSRWLSDSALCVAGPMRHTAAHADLPEGAVPCWAPGGERVPGAPRGLPEAHVVVPPVPAQVVSR